MVKKETSKKAGLLIVGLIFIFGILSFAYAQDWPAFNVCCEKTIEGAWCQNNVEKNCDLGYRKTPTSCEATSFCKPGCCIDSYEGLCMKNTPQKVCDISEGTWVDDEMCDVPQCDLGCCILGDQASFVTLTRCKRLSAIYGLETNFKKDTKNEASCIMLAYSQEKGACVYELETQKTCKFTTRAECSNEDKKGNITSDSEFFPNYLCSADELATNCGPTTETICVPGKDEVYFKDSCGNPANIYDANRIYPKDKSYWQKIVQKTEACGYTAKNGKGNVNSKTCGNCDYLQGSMCGEGSATYGDYICKDLNCYNTKNGQSYKNGESWCEYQGETGNGMDLVGSRQFRHICIQGEEIVEPCADFRNEVCIEGKYSSSQGNFLEAACRVNRWTDCLEQYDEEHCLNQDKRDCFWFEGFHYQNTKAGLETNVSQEENKGILNGDSICLPNNPPGLKFWEDGEAKNICGLGNSLQIVEYKANIFGTKTCTKNCDVLTSGWVTKINEVCKSLGDCGAYSNIAGVFTDDGIMLKSNGKKKVLGGILGSIEISAESEETKE